MKQDKIDPEAVFLGGPAGLFIEENIVRWYIEKHPKAGPSEIGFINSMITSSALSVGRNLRIRIQRKEVGYWDDDPP